MWYIIRWLVLCFHTIFSPTYMYSTTVGGSLTPTEGRTMCLVQHQTSAVAQKNQSLSETSRSVNVDWWRPLWFQMFGLSSRPTEQWTDAIDFVFKVTYFHPYACWQVFYTIETRTTSPVCLCLIHQGTFFCHIKVWIILIFVLLLFLY